MRNRVEADRARLLSPWRRAERVFDAAFGSHLNPLRHLGALACLAFALLVATGAVLYVMLDTSVGGAHGSIEALTRTPWSWGSLLRGAHRYAADTFALTIGLHVVREWLHGHESGFRSFSWWTGVPLVALAGAAAIGGFWLNWDVLGQYSAVATAEWLDALPLFATPLAANFLSAATVSDRLFSLFFFVHIGVPLLLVFGLWFHVQRLTRPAVLPPRALAWGTVVTLLVLAGIAPVSSHGPASLSSVPQVLRLDWMLLWVHPLAELVSPATTWLLLGSMFALLLALPFLRSRSAAQTVAVVNAEHCNGCRRCFADCPYAAITMAPHPQRPASAEVAVVDADLCASCGICAGACPSSTPFRRSATLVTGIDMPQRPLDALREQLRTATATRPIVVFGCDCGARLDTLPPHSDVRAVSLLCAGQLPPSFVELALREGAAGVVVAACREDGCAFRFGSRMARERLEGLREPGLRASARQAKVSFVNADRGEEAVVQDVIERLRHA